LAAALESDFAGAAWDRLHDIPDLVDLARVRRIAVVGCGPVPVTAFFLEEKSAAEEIVALDRNAQATDLARRLIRHLGTKRIGVQVGDGGSVDYGRFDLVYVTNHVSPKLAVLERIADTAPAGVHVLVRQGFGLGRLLSESIDDATPRGLRVVRCCKPDPVFHAGHLLLARDARP